MAQLHLFQPWWSVSNTSSSTNFTAGYKAISRKRLHMGGGLMVWAPEAQNDKNWGRSRQESTPPWPQTHCGHRRAQKNAFRGSKYHL